MRNYCFSFVAFAAALLIAGCSGEKAEPPVTSQKTKPAVAKPEKQVSARPAVARRSVFTIDQNSRDPFFPQARKAPVAAAAVAVVAAQSPAADIPALLSAGLQGIGGTPGRHIALINNTMLEPGRSTVIPIQVGKEQRKISVKCKEVARNSVVLEVEGYGLLVVKPKETL